MKNIIVSFVIFGICAGIFLSQNPRKYADFAESQNNPSLRADSQNLRGNPKDLRAERSNHPHYKNTQKPQGGLPRSHSLARNDEILDSSLRLHSAQNDNLKLDSATKMPQDEFAYLLNIFPSAHSSSLTDLGERLLVSYFAGSKEGASDVKIMAHFMDKSTLHSTPPREILSAQTLSNLSGKFIKKLGNPLIFKSADGALHFFVVGVSLGGWATSKIYHLQLSDDLETLILRKELRLGLLGNFSHLIRTPPLMLENGGFMLPLYHELARKYPLVAFFDENGEFSHALRPNYLKNQLQPTIIALNQSECLAFFRNHKAYQNASFLQKCERGGAIWKSPNATNLKAWDDSSVLLHYKNAENKSRILLLYNDGKVAESSNSRRSLGLYYLVDSAPKSQKDKFIFLQNIDIVDEAYPNEVSYPSAVIDENALFVGYTYNRKWIKIKKLNLAEIEKKIAESTLFGGLESRGLKGDSSFGKSQKKQKLLKELCEVGEIKGASHKSFLDSAIRAKIAESATFCHSNSLSCHSKRCEESQKNPSLRANPQDLRGNPPYEKSQNPQSGLPRSHSLARNDENLDSSLRFLSAQNDKIKKSQNDNIHLDSATRAKIAESSAESSANYDIFGVYLLFLSAFLFFTKSLSKRIKYFALPCFVAFISIPFIFVLWDYYSLVMLFYSLFGGVSLFCTLLCAKYILQKTQNLQGGLPRKYFVFARNDNVKYLALALATFSLPLFLGHLGLVDFDILRSEIASAIFVSAFVVALFWVNKWAFIFALVALIFTKSLFGLFDGYLLIFSVVYCAIWAVKWSFKKIIAQA